jgi:predicted nuclease of predicted toxin-antitoxin system
VNFLVDNQLPLALAQHLRTRGLDCQHVLDIGLAEASDADICRYAEAQARVILSARTKIFSTLPAALTPKSRLFGSASGIVELPR